MPPVGPHDDAPAKASKDRPRVPRHLRPHNLAHAPLFLHRQLGQSKHRSCKHINDDLLIDAALNATAKNDIATEEPGKECVHRGFFPGGRGDPEEDHSGFVHDCVRSQVTCVLPGGFEDEVEFLAQSDTVILNFRGEKAEIRRGNMDVRAGTEKKDHAANGPRVCVSASDNRLQARYTEC